MLTRRAIRIIDSKPHVLRKLGSLLMAIAILIVTFPADALGWIAVFPTVAAAVGAVCLWQRAIDVAQRQANYEVNVDAIERSLDEA